MRHDVGNDLSGQVCVHNYGKYGRSKLNQEVKLQTHNGVVYNFTICLYLLFKIHLTNKKVYLNPVILSVFHITGI